MAFGVGLRTVRLPTTYAAERASISRWTLHKIERGHAGVAIGAYARVLASCGLLGRLERVPEVRWCRQDVARELGLLPQRVRRGPEQD